MEVSIAGSCGFGDSLRGADHERPTDHGANDWEAQTQLMFRLAYLSFIGAVLSMPVHLVTNLELTRWAIFGLAAAAITFLTVGIVRRP